MIISVSFNSSAYPYFSPFYDSVGDGSGSGALPAGASPFTLAFARPSLSGGQGVPGNTGVSSAHGMSPRNGPGLSPRNGPGLSPRNGPVLSPRNGGAQQQQQQLSGMPALGLSYAQLLSTSAPGSVSAKGLNGISGSSPFEHVSVTGSSSDSSSAAASAAGSTQMLTRNLNSLSLSNNNQNNNNSNANDSTRFYNLASSSSASTPRFGSVDHQGSHGTGVPAPVPAPPVHAASSPGHLVVSPRTSVFSNSAAAAAPGISPVALANGGSGVNGNGNGTSSGPSSARGVMSGLRVAVPGQRVPQPPNAPSPYTNSHGSSASNGGTSPPVTGAMGAAGIPMGSVGPAGNGAATTGPYDDLQDYSYATARGAHVFGGSNNNVNANTNNTSGRSSVSSSSAAVSAAVSAAAASQGAAAGAVAPQPPQGQRSVPTPTRRVLAPLDPQSARGHGHGNGNAGSSTAPDADANADAKVNNAGAEAGRNAAGLRGVTLAPVLLSGGDSVSSPPPHSLMTPSSPSASIGSNGGPAAAPAGTEGIGHRRSLTVGDVDTQDARATTRAGNNSNGAKSGAGNHTAGDAAVAVAVLNGSLSPTFADRQSMALAQIEHYNNTHAHNHHQQHQQQQQQQQHQHQKDASDVTPGSAHGPLHHSHSFAPRVHTHTHNNGHTSARGRAQPARGHHSRPGSGRGHSISITDTAAADDCGCDADDNGSSSNDDAGDDAGRSDDEDAYDADMYKYNNNINSSSSVGRSAGFSSFTPGSSNNMTVNNTVNMNPTVSAHSASAAPNVYMGAPGRGSVSSVMSSSSSSAASAGIAGNSVTSSGAIAPRRLAPSAAAAAAEAASAAAAANTQQQQQQQQQQQSSLPLSLQQGLVNNGVGISPCGATASSQLTGALSSHSDAPSCAHSIFTSNPNAPAPLLMASVGAGAGSRCASPAAGRSLSPTFGTGCRSPRQSDRGVVGDRASAAAAAAAAASNGSGNGNGNGAVSVNAGFSAHVTAPRLTSHHTADALARISSNLLSAASPSPSPSPPLPSAHLHPPGHGLGLGSSGFSALPSPARSPTPLQQQPTIPMPFVHPLRVAASPRNVLAANAAAVISGSNGAVSPRNSVFLAPHSAAGSAANAPCGSVAGQAHAQAAAAAALAHHHSFSSSGGSSGSNANASFNAGAQQQQQQQQQQQLQQAFASEYPHNGTVAVSLSAFSGQLPPLYISPSMPQSISHSQAPSQAPSRSSSRASQHPVSQHPALGGGLGSIAAGLPVSVTLSAGAALGGGLGLGAGAGLGTSVSGATTPRQRGRSLADSPFTPALPAALASASALPGSGENDSSYYQHASPYNLSVSGPPSGVHGPLASAGYSSVTNVLAASMAHGGAGGSCPQVQYLAVGNGVAPGTIVGVGGAVVNGSYYASRTATHTPDITRIHSPAASVSSATTPASFSTSSASASTSASASASASSSATTSALASMSASPAAFALGASAALPPLAAHGHGHALGHGHGHTLGLGKVTTPRSMVASPMPMAPGAIFEDDEEGDALESLVNR